METRLENVCMKPCSTVVYAWTNDFYTSFCFILASILTSSCESLRQFGSGQLRRGKGSLLHPPREGHSSWMSVLPPSPSSSTSCWSRSVSVHCVALFVHCACACMCSVQLSFLVYTNYALLSSTVLLFFGYSFYLIALKLSRPEMQLKCVTRSAVKFMAYANNVCWALFPLVTQVSLIVEILHLSLTLGVGPVTSQAQYLSHAPEAISARFRYALSLHMYNIYYVALLPDA